VLAWVFRSLVIPLTAAVMNLLSAAAAFGVLTAVFQWGWATTAIGAGTRGPVESIMPVLLFPVLFGLSMDYQVSCSPASTRGGCGTATTAARYAKASPRPAVPSPPRRSS
jgi:uncharacterized membrane protein YdfJ with MMPL/SSD domain